ncbi:RNA terminal phosphate cyclase domain 1 [Mycena indigotica]|uniref:RNA 3'-terminal-phosphate cyclase (ATP) n=1 Tax=Mycena indigotica TaxID=2126181 RepID=A0A8H6SC71_9AGAR|nr:RNA terminal phosphate cyclase domain 1 [Mycena indigotica]KAF7295165.1 RNA terminal phosphate cyclase domain 1 [Mycena indigotica]
MQFIDGSILEGGGQILRNATSLSALLGKPITIQKIRQGRRPPGLKTQHRTGLELAARISSAHIVGVANGAETIEFSPGEIIPGDYHADPQTAGASALLLQIALPLLLFGSKSSTLTLKGGTNATGAPQIDYIQHVFLPFAKRHFGLTVELNLRRRGYFPKGGGEIHVTVNPSHRLKAASVMERGSVTSIQGIAHVAGLPSHLADKMRDSAIERLSRQGFVSDSIPIQIRGTRERNDNTVGGGSGIVLWAELSGGGIIGLKLLVFAKLESNIDYSGGSAVGSKQKDAATVGSEAAEELIRGLDNGGVVDEYLQDQIVILMALASPENSSEIQCGTGGLSLHTRRELMSDRTAIWVAEQLTNAKFNVSVEAGQTVIRCKGIGYSASTE